MHPKNTWLQQAVVILASKICFFVCDCVGTAETVEGGDQLPAGLCPLVVFCQSAWRRAGEMLENGIQH